MIDLSLKKCLKTRKMDRDLEDKIDTLIQKATTELKTRIVREVTRSMNRVLKEQARELKSGGDGTATKRGRKVTASSSDKTSSKSTKSGKSKDMHGSDSDDYYSE